MRGAITSTGCAGMFLDEEKGNKKWARKNLPIPLSRFPESLRVASPFGFAFDRLFRTQIQYIIPRCICQRFFVEILGDGRNRLPFKG